MRIARSNRRAQLLTLAAVAFVSLFIGLIIGSGFGSTTTAVGSPAGAATSPPPFQDVGAGVFVTGSEAAFTDLRQTVCNLGQRRVADFNTPPLVQRDIWPGFVTNVNNPKVLAALGYPTAALTIVVDNPRTAAGMMVRHFRAINVRAKAIRGSVAGDDDRDLMFVRVAKGYLKAGLFVLRVRVDRLHKGPTPLPQSTPC